MIWPALPIVYSFIKFWLPLVTFLGLMVKGAQLVGRRLSMIANTFLDNHMAHIQSAAETASVAVTELAGYHKEMLQAQGRIVNSIEIMSQDFHEHTLDDARVQTALLQEIRDHRQADRTHYESVVEKQAEVISGLEYLKAKLD